MVAHTRSHLLLGAVPGTGPTNDSPDLPPALRQAAALLPVDTVLGDAAYDAEPHHRLCRDTLGIPHRVIALNLRGSRRWPTTPYRRALRRHFPREIYRQRWHAESVFSRHKRHLGSALRARSLDARSRELVLRVLTHNLMILRRQQTSFQQSNPLSHYSHDSLSHDSLSHDSLSHWTPTPTYAPTQTHSYFLELIALSRTRLSSLLASHRCSPLIVTRPSLLMYHLRDTAPYSAP